MFAYACLLLVAGVASAPAQPVPERPAAVVARAVLGGRVIDVRTDEIALEIAVATQNGERGAALSAATVDGLRGMVDRVIERKLLAAESSRRRIDQESGVRNLLTRSSEAVLADTLVLREAAAADTSDRALERYFAQHQDEFRSAPRRKASHVVVATEEEVRAARAEIASGRAFAEVAQARNIDSTAKNGGDLGWVAQGAMVRAFDDVLFEVARGTISAPVQTSMGWHLILVHDVDPGTVPPLGLVRERIVEAVRRDAVERLTKRLLAEAKPAVERTVLEGLLQ